MDALNLSKDDRVKLKGCPFCGGQANHYAIAEHKHVFVDWVPSFPGCYVIECVGCDFYMSKNDSAEAFAAWNRRHDETPSEFERLIGGTQNV